MSVIIIPRRHYTQPQGRVELDLSHPSALGLSAIYVLTPGQWGRDLVTGQWRGLVVGAEPGFAANKLRTSGNKTNVVRLPHGLGESVAAPLTFLIGATKISGTVSWSLLNDTVSSWNGWHSAATGAIETSSDSSFTGKVSGVGSIGVFTHNGTVLSGFGATEPVDTSTNNPTIPTQEITLGCARRLASDNASVTEFELFGVYSRVLDPIEARELSKNPWQLTRADPIRIYSLPSGPVGISWSSLTAGNITQTGATLTLGGIVR